MGSFKGLKQIRRIVEECMLNQMHPVFNIKVNRYEFDHVDIENINILFIFYSRSYSYDEERT